MTAPGTRRRRGEPLAALVLVLVGWTAARAVLWDAPLALRSPVPSLPLAAAPRPVPPLERRLAGRLSAGLPAARRFAHVAAPFIKRAGPRPAERVSSAQGSLPIQATKPFVQPASGEPALRSLAPSVPTITAWEPATAAPRIHASRRLRVDGWIAWRAGSGLPRLAAGARPASYGGTQAGVVARYTLGTSDHRPALHLRASYAPDRPRQAELAAGAGARPIAGVPLRLQGELRATRTGGASELRPAVFAVTELAPVRLGFEFTGEAYAQAGWVGGRFATAFADGQARVTREVASAGPVRIAAGAGAWGGAQRFAERIDVGPSVTVALAEGPVPLRLALDYRVRVAGAAAPGNGLAVTLSTGF